MTEETHDHAPPRRKRIGWAVGLVAAGALGGGLMMVTVPAFADPSSDPTPTASSSASADAPHRGGGGQRSDETVLTGTDAEKAKAAALVAVPGGTVDRVETDADGAAYEAHMTKSDGTRVTVKFDSSFTVTGVEDGMGSHKTG